MMSVGIPILGGTIDLLAIDPEGNLTVIELKRDRMPRDVVAGASFAEYLHAVADVPAFERRCPMSG